MRAASSSREKRRWAAARTHQEAHSQAAMGLVVMPQQVTLRAQHRPDLEPQSAPRSWGAQRPARVGPHSNPRKDVPSTAHAGGRAETEPWLPSFRTLHLCSRVIVSPQHAGPPRTLLPGSLDRLVSSARWALRMGGGLRDEKSVALGSIDLTEQGRLHPDVTAGARSRDRRGCCNGDRAAEE